MKVSDLEGAKLDYWVARAEGEPAIFEYGECRYHYDDTDGTWEDGWTPSADWETAGPIIEREGIFLGHDPDGWWAAKDVSLDCSPEDEGNGCFGSIYRHGEQRGPTPLIAAMRCFVASKFGKDVPDDERSKT